MSRAKQVYEAILAARPEGKTTFDSEYNLDDTQAKKLAKGLGLKWDITKSGGRAYWNLKKGKEPIGTYSPTQGKLTTDMKWSEVKLHIK